MVNPTTKPRRFNRLKNVIRAARNDTSLGDSFLDMFSINLTSRGISANDIDDAICEVCGSNPSFSIMFGQCKKCELREQVMKDFNQPPPSVEEKPPRGYMRQV